MTDNGCCSNGTSCGCRVDVFPTSRDCPDCGKKLRLTGSAQTLQLRLNCRNCGYSSALLSQDELREVL
jgi:hypothetical protein